MFAPGAVQGGSSECVCVCVCPCLCYIGGFNELLIKSDIPILALICRMDYFFFIPRVCGR